MTMYGENEYSLERIEKLCQQIEAAWEAARRSGQDTATLDALESSLTQLRRLTAPAAKDTTSRHAAYLDYTFDDEDCPPYGRQLEVRIHYDWSDYDRADEPFSVWGAQVADVEVLAVRYFDQNGDAVEVDAHHADVAWLLLERNREQVTEACTADGCRRGVGAAHPLYAPPARRAAASSAALPAPRMAPSQRTRTVPNERRQHG
jgi:hypothetical protein